MSDSRLIDHRDMTAEQILQCNTDALALLHLCDQAAWVIQNTDHSPRAAQFADSISVALRLSMELLAPVHEALASHEGVKREALPKRMVGGERNDSETSGKP